MSRGVVFKQRYKSRNLASTATLNRKHLVYIATRPGAVHNPGCAFGLWGRLPGVLIPENIDDLRLAKKAVTQASKEHTLYRAVISVDRDTAKGHDLYNRKTWEGLINAKIDIIAKEMGIRPGDFCWVASMHYEKSHPHVHIMYWDSSDAIHQEHIPKERFEIMAERVRSAFGREIYHEDIIELRKAEREDKSELRLELKALLREANLAEALDLSHVSIPARDQLTAMLVELAATAPIKGRLAYGFLSADYKAKVDAFVDEVLKISDFQKVVKRYGAAAREISSLNGNGEEKTAYEVKKALEELRRNLGNEVMDCIKECRRELALDVPTDRTELQAVLQGTAENLLRAKPEYGALLEQMPKLRTPTRALLQDEDFTKQLHKLAWEVCSDMRISARLHGYVDAQGIKDKEERKVLLADIQKEAHRGVAGLILENLRQDAGYSRQAQADIVTNLLIRLLGDASRSAGQQQARRDLTQLRSKDKSKTAQRDRQTQLEQAGHWPTPE